MRPAFQDRIDAIPDDDDWAVRAAEALLAEADRLRCSDLHVAPRPSGLAVRARRDGALLPLAEVGTERRDALVARFKVLARLPAYNRHEPQDGRIDWAPGDGAAPRVLRASFLPTIHGQGIVIRFPEHLGPPPELGALGMRPEALEAADRLLACPGGAILVTGPSGSGKTTTLYAMMRRIHELQRDRLNFVTIEDPVERELDFASQVQVNPPAGLTFDKALRAAIRHDPNVILIGEIRDAETARIAVQAGMTGHVVLTTLHAGRAARVFTRLLSVGLEPYLVASAVSGAIAQRLARRLCPSCRRRRGDGDWEAPGCGACDQSGFSGRTGLFELVTVAEPLREAILGRASPGEIAAACARAQVGDLVDEGQRLAGDGVLSRAELAFLFAFEGETP